MISAGGDAAETGLTRGSVISLILVVVCLVLFSEGLVQRLVTGEEDSEGNIILRVMWLPVYALIIAMVIPKSADLFRLGLAMPCLVLLIGLASVSFVWSIDPALSLRRGVSVAMTTIFAAYLAVRFDWLVALKLLGAVWLAMAILSFVAALIAPEFARVQEIHAGAWRGFWFEKNTLGGHMARAALIFGTLILVDTARQRLWVFALLLASVLVILSTSMTSLLGLMIAYGVLIGGVILQWNRVSAVLTLWLGVVGFAVAVFALLLLPEVVFGAIGKDPSLTGRTDIWSAIMVSLAERPWLGYGYGAFWGIDSKPAFWVRDVLEWDAPTAHNGWLDVALSTGLIGLAAFAGVYAAMAVRIVRIVFDHRFGLFAAGVFLQFTLFSLSESVVLEQNSLTWITFVMVAALLVRGAGRSGKRNRIDLSNVRRRLRTSQEAHI